MLVAYLVAALLVAAVGASPLPETSEPLETVVSPDLERRSSSASK